MNASNKNLSDDKRYQSTIETLEHVIEELREEIENLRTANDLLDTEKQALQEDVQSLQDKFDDREGIVEEFLTAPNAQHKSIEVVVSDNSFELVFNSLDKHSWNYSELRFDSQSLEDYLKLRDEKERCLNCEIERLRATVGMLGITSSVPNAEEIANEQNQMARK